ncbi:MAG: preprotein translocase subunit SecG [Acidobacteria bacterium]|nr:preprotein translocase subunit SecG [Acidobacteriota bacterium]MBA3784037.1 preprotein translocase subunit SecG [Acidobacteriota bacterium]MBA4182752.1 preprotein translocase subunit SecG [Acidobacteriota bacterium]
MAYFLYILFFASCIALIASVLLQPGKTDAGALFTSNISSTAFQPRGAQTILSKITIAAATVFMLSALLLAMPALTGNISVLDTVGETPSESTVTPDANVSVDANANAAIDTNANININSASNVAVLTNTNSLTNAVTNANAAVNTVSNTNTTVNANP